MLTNTYKYAVWDLSFLLSRNLFAVSRNKKIGQFTAGDVVKMSIQTVNKVARDYHITADKNLFFCDLWNSDFDGYERTRMLSGNYKDTRTWMTPEKLEELKNTPGVEEKDIEKAEFELYQNKIKQEAKQILKYELSQFCIPSIEVEGWEYDDLAWLFACKYYESGPTKKSVLITKDTDVLYSINPAVDYFKLPTAKSTPKTITYDEMYNQIPQSLRDRGVGLYQYNALLNAVGETHNDMRRTKYPKADLLRTLEKVSDEDYDWIKDLDLFQLQLSTFDLNNFRRLDEAIYKVTNTIQTNGRIGGLEEFKTFCSSHGITGISDKYYTDFSGRFDQKLFTE